MQSLPQSEQSPHPVFKYRGQRKSDPERLQAIEKFIEGRGIYAITRSDVRQHLIKALPHKKPLKPTEIGWVLRNKFHLTYKKIQGGFVRYLDP